MEVGSLVKMDVSQNSLVIVQDKVSIITTMDSKVGRRAGIAWPAGTSWKWYEDQGVPKGRQMGSQQG